MEIYRYAIELLRKFGIVIGCKRKEISTWQKYHYTFMSTYVFIIDS